LGLQGFSVRGASDIVTGGGAFATGGTIGTVASSFAQLSPFNPSGFTQPKVSDLGSTTNGGASITSSTADGILDFGGTISPQKFTSLSSTSGLVFGGGTTGSANSTTLPQGWQWEVGTFQFTIGTVSATNGAKTQFFPLLLTSVQGSATAGVYSVNAGANISSGPLTVGSPLTFVVASPKGSATWNRNGNGNYSDFTSWDPNQIPGAAGSTATFGNGTTNSVNVPNVTVTMDAPQSVGTINFNNTNGTSFTLGNDGVAAHSLTLDNSGAGANVNSVTGNNAIFSNLVLNDNATFNVSAGSSVLLSLGNISETGGSRTITKMGAGTLTIDTLSTYTGSTLVTGGTMLTTPTGTISTGPLVVSTTSGVTSLANLDNNQTVSSLSGTASGSGSATVRVASGTTLTVNQTRNTTFAGAISLGASGGTLVKSASGILETQGAPTLGNTSAITVNGGKLRFNVTTGAATIGSGVVATISNAATLELAGSVSALSSSDSPAHRVNIANSSTAAAGLLVSGTNQQVGNIDGNGTTSVAAGAGFTANHIIQSALVIGGTSASPATVTIAASNSSGNPLAILDGIAISPTSGTVGSTSMLTASASHLRQPGLMGSVANGLAPVGNSSAVPEPSTVLLAALSALCCLGTRWRKLDWCA
jgi:hypothetical protein